MKKAILLTILALALPASAASIDWALNTGGTANYMVGKDGNKLNGRAYLFLTDILNTATLETEQDIIDLALDARDDGEGGLKGVLEIANGVNKTVVTTTDSRITPVDGATALSFTVLIYDSVGKSFYTTTAKTQTAYNLSGDEFTDAKQITMSMSEVYATSATRGTQTWTSVPEPSVALMGLLGLGMLLKRRKA